MTFSAKDTGLAVLDESFKVVAVNKALEMVLKVDRKRIIGRKCGGSFIPKVLR